MKHETISAGPVTTFTKRVVETVRMYSGSCDEINDSKHGIVRADSEGYFMVPIEMLDAARQAGLVPAPLSQGARLRDVFDAIDKLDAGDMRTALRAAATAESLKVGKIAA